MPGRVQCYDAFYSGSLSSDIDESSLLKHNSRLTVNKKVGPIRLTGVVCTIGPACNTVPMIQKLIDNGMNIARMNFSHGDHQYHQGVINTVREAAAKYLPQTVAIALDTKGPEIRTGSTENNAQINLATGSSIILTTDEKYKNNCNSERLYIDYKGLVSSVSIGYEIYCADGYVVFKVDDIVDKLNLKCTIKSGGTIGSKKNCNLPGVKVDLPALSQKDKDDIVFGVKNDIDMIFASFIRTRSNVEEIRTLLKEFNSPHIKIISKIENQEGVDNINDVIDASDGIMVARGDLGMEVPIERVIIAQKIMISSCNIIGKPVICATQMLESMITNVRPTRAEVADVYNAVLDGSDCVMLSGETANGKFPDVAVSTMSKTCLIAESANADYRFYNDVRNNTKIKDNSESIAFAAASISYQLSNLHAIIVLSTSGTTAHQVSKFKPKCPILLVSRYVITCRQAHLFRGVIPLLFSEKVDEQWQEDVDKRLLFAVDYLRKWCVVADGSYIAFITGWRKGKGSSNDLRILLLTGNNGIEGLTK